MTKEQIEEIIRHPVSWIAAGVGTLLGVIGTVAFDPTGSFAAILALLFDMSTTLFTALSIMAFTVLPNVPVPQTVVDLAVAGAIFMGILAVVRILAKVGGRLKSRLDE